MDPHQLKGFHEKYISVSWKFSAFVAMKFDVKLRLFGFPRLPLVVTQIPYKAILLLTVCRFGIFCTYPFVIVRFLCEEKRKTFYRLFNILRLYASHFVAGREF